VIQTLRSRTKEDCRPRLKHDTGSCVSFPYHCINYVYTAYQYELGLSMGLTNSPQFCMWTLCKMKRTRTGHLQWHGESTHKQVQDTHAQRARASPTHTLAGTGPRPRPTGFETRKQVQCTRIQVQSMRTQRGRCDVSSRARVPDVSQALVMSTALAPSSAYYACSKWLRMARLAAPE